MMYDGFVVMYTWGKNHPDQSVHFEGPCSTIQEAHKKYEELLELNPCVENVRVGRIVTNPSDPKLY